MIRKRKRWRSHIRSDLQRKKGQKPRHKELCFLVMKMAIGRTVWFSFIAWRCHVQLLQPTLKTTQFQNTMMQHWKKDAVRTVSISRPFTAHRSEIRHSLNEEPHSCISHFALSINAQTGHSIPWFAGGHFLRASQVANFQTNPKHPMNKSKTTPIQQDPLLIHQALSHLYIQRPRKNPR